MLKNSNLSLDSLLSELKSQISFYLPPRSFLGLGQVNKEWYSIINKPNNINNDYWEQKVKLNFPEVYQNILQNRHLNTQLFDWKKIFKESYKEFINKRYENYPAHQKRLLILAKKNDLQAIKSMQINPYGLLVQNEDGLTILLFHASQEIYDYLHADVFEKALKKQRENDNFLKKFFLRDKIGPPQLCWAAAFNQIKKIKELLKQGENIDEADDDAQTPLNIAAQKGHSVVVAILLKNGANPHLACNRGRTPLHAAASKGFMEIVKVLLEKKADPNLATKNGVSPLILAAKYGHAEIVQILLKKGADVNAQCPNNGTTALYSAAQNDHLQVVKILLKNGADSSLQSFGITTLSVAVRKGHIEIVRVLLRKGIDPNLICNSGESPLFIAVKNGHAELVETLLANGANPNFMVNNVPLIFITAQVYSPEILRILLTCGADPNLKCDQDKTLLYVAAEKGLIEIINILLENGANPNLPCKNKRTPLHIAAQNGHMETVRILIANCADPDLVSEKLTPFHAAIMEDNTSVAKKLAPFAFLFISTKLRQYIDCSANNNLAAAEALQEYIKGKRTDESLDPYRSTLSANEEINSLYKDYKDIQKIIDPRRLKILQVDEVIKKYSSPEFNESNNNNFGVNFNR